MSTEVIPEVVVIEEQVDPAISKIREDRKLAEAVRDYLEEVERFENARIQHNDKYNALRLLTNGKPSTTLVVSGGYGRYHSKSFLLTVSDSGSFQVKSVEVI